MMIVKFRTNEEHEELLKKVKKMKKFTEELQECLEEAYEDEPEYRGGSYRKHDDEDYEMKNSRYSYRRGM